MKKHRTFPRFGVQFRRRHEPLGYKINESFMADFIDTNLGESSSGCDFLHTVNEGAEVSCSNIWVSNKLDEIINNDHCTTLNLHTSVIQSTKHERHKNSERGCCDFSNKSGARQSFDTCWY